MSEVFFYVLLCRNRQRLLLSYRVQVSLCLTTIRENLFLNNKRHKKTEPHKKHEQPAKQLLLKSLVLAIKLFVNLLLLSIARKVVRTGTFTPLKSGINILSLFCFFIH
jgi:hypothetical protein